MRAFRIAVLALVVVGCSGTTALQRHATAATVVNDTAIAAHDLVVDLRRAELDAAARVAQDTGADVAAAVHAAGDRFDARGLPAAVDALIAADEAYALAILAWTAHDQQPATVVPALRAVIAAYNALRKALGERGERLPAVPTSVASLIGGGS